MQFGLEPVHLPWLWPHLLLLLLRLLACLYIISPPKQRKGAGTLTPCFFGLTKTATSLHTPALYFERPSVLEDVVEQFSYQRPCSEDPRFVFFVSDKQTCLVPMQRFPEVPDLSFPELVQYPPKSSCSHHHLPMLVLLGAILVQVDPDHGSGRNTQLEPDALNSVSQNYVYRKLLSS